MLKDGIVYACAALWKSALKNLNSQAYESEAEVELIYESDNKKPPGTFC